LRLVYFSRDVPQIAKNNAIVGAESTRRMSDWILETAKVHTKAVRVPIRGTKSIHGNFLLELVEGAPRVM
jgi:hypothetical protein